MYISTSTCTDVCDIEVLGGWGWGIRNCQYICVIEPKGVLGMGRRVEDREEGLGRE